MNAITLPLAILWLAFGMIRLDESGSAKPPVVDVFSGQTLPVEIAVATPAGKPVEIQADLFQKAQSLLAPLQKDVPVARDVSSPSSGAFRPLISWNFTAPTVKRETEVLACLRFRAEGSEWTSAGQISFKIYPPDIAQETLARLAKEPGLRVFGKDARLRDFLKSRQIDFEDVGSDLAGLHADPEDKAIYLGDAPFREFTRWLNQHEPWPCPLAVFCGDGTGLPGVFVNAQDGSRTAKVTLPVLDHLATDPRSQKTLVDILNSITAP